MQALLLHFVLTNSFLLLSSIREGSAGITSSFVRSEWPSVDIPLNHEAFAVPKGYNAPQQVHITQGDYDGKAVIISWVTPDEPGPSNVQFGTSENKFQASAEGTVSNYTFYKYKSGYIHHCLVEGLEYNTKYYYRIGSGDSSREFWFETPPKVEPDAAYKFGIIGDLGQTFNSLSTVEHYIESGAQTVLYVGDFSYADRYKYTDVGLRWDTWGRFVEKSTAYQPWIWSAGNHEIEFMPYMYNTKYYYRIGSGDSSREFWFETPPKVEPDAAYKFGIIGDLGQTFNSLSTVEHYIESGAQTVLYVGDFSYADRYQYTDVGLRWDTWGRFVEKSTAYQPWIWSAGNHEIEFMPYMGEVVPFKSYLHRYPTPYLASKSSNPLWYAIRRASAHIIVLSSYSPFVKYTLQWVWLREELERVDREKTPWLIVLMHVPLYNSNEAHYMEGESMRAVFESWFIKYKVDVVFAGHVHAYERSYRISNITSGYRYPVADKSAPVYITVGDGGNRAGLASRFMKPQPEYSAFREASYGHSTLEIKNRTHAVYHWNRNDDGKKVPTDSFVLHNQYS